MTVLPDFLTAPSGSALPLPRLLVILAHPDDEVLALGGRMDRLRASRLLCVTDGAPASGTDVAAHGFTSREQYRDARRAELRTALSLAGLPAICAATLTIGPASPQQPSTVADQSAAFHLLPLAYAIRREIEEFRPDAILTHPYEGGHPDHDSTAFAVHAALRLPGACTPLLIEAPSYHARSVQHPGEHGIQTGRFPAPPAPQTPETHYDLSPDEQARKTALLGCFRSQRETLAQFSTATECFRPAPAYDFTQPPHPGTLFYEQFEWGMTGSRFRELVRLALSDLERR